MIRKIMGAIAMTLSNDLPENFLDNSFFHNKIQIWLAPAEGLYLDRIAFDGYNLKEDKPETLEFD